MHTEKLRMLLDMFAGIADEAKRSELLLEFAGQFSGVPDSIARRPYPPGNKVPACDSDAYIWGVTRPDGTLEFYFAVENTSGISAKALAVILDRTLSGAPPELVANVPPDTVQRIFRQNISIGEGMGLMSMVENVRRIAGRHTQPEHKS